MNLFKALTVEETREFQQWARANYKPFTPISGIWHPAVQEECVRMNMEGGGVINSTAEPEEIKSQGGFKS